MLHFASGSEQFQVHHFLWAYISYPKLPIIALANHACVSKGTEVIYDQTDLLIQEVVSTRFWEDSWLGDGPLASQYPNLYANVN
jgi:hypothetical protein